MKQHLLFLLGIIMTMLTSCDSSYTYVEKIEELDINGGTTIKDKEQEFIKAPNDTLAYYKAFEKYCISRKANENISKRLGVSYPKPVGFKLLNSKGEDVTEIVPLVQRLKEEEAIEQRIFSLPSSTKNGDSKENETNDNSSNYPVKKDSAQISELIKFFTKTKDEFSPQGLTWYKPKSAPKYTNRNGLYCYFQTENDVPSNLRLRFQYYSENWIFIRKVQFLIDGQAFEYTPLNLETDSGDGGMIWEWFDESVSDQNLSILIALANAKTAKIKLIGSKYYDVKNISQNEITSIKQTLRLYSAMGGSLSN